jgi:hypothetical protein
MATTTPSFSNMTATVCSICSPPGLGRSANIRPAATTFGASRRQLLWGVRVPLALPAMMLAVNQGILMAPAMVIIAGPTGGGGLGYLIVDTFTPRRDRPRRRGGPGADADGDNPRPSHAEHRRTSEIVAADALIELAKPLLRCGNLERLAGSRGAAYVAQRVLDRALARPRQRRGELVAAVDGDRDGAARPPVDVADLGRHAE